MPDKNYKDVCEELFKWADSDQDGFLIGVEFMDFMSGSLVAGGKNPEEAQQMQRCNDNQVWHTI